MDAENSTGSKAPTAAEGVAAYLEWDHRRLDALFEALRRDARAGHWDRARAGWAQFDAGLRRHIDVEETMLFPVFEEKTGMREGGPTAVMRMEHRQIQNALAQAAEGVAHGGLDVLERSAETLMDVLVQHNRKEEHILYPMCDSVMSAAERAALIARMQASPRA